MSDIAKCPFCDDDGAPYLQSWVNGRNPPETSWSVECTTCKRAGNTYNCRTASTKEEAIQRWNVWPRWRQPHDSAKYAHERRILDNRIANQRARLRWFERLFDQGARSHKRKLFSIHNKVKEQEIEIDRLEAENAQLREERDEYKGLFEIVQQVNIEIAKLAEKEGVLIRVSPPSEPVAEERKP